MAVESFPVVEQSGVGTLIVKDAKVLRTLEEILLVLDEIIEVVLDLETGESDGA